MTTQLPSDPKQAIRSLIRVIPDFPVPRCSFSDITPILEQAPHLFNYLIDEMVKPYRHTPPDVILCIESFGYVFGAPMAYLLSSRMVLARRAGKLPRATLRETYDMGYARDRQMELHAEALKSGDRVVIVDDFLASGGTATAALNLVQRAGGNCIGLSCAIGLDNPQFHTQMAQRGVPVHAVIEYR